MDADFRLLSQMKRGRKRPSNALFGNTTPASCNTATTTSRKSTTRRTSPKRPLPGSSPPWTDTSTTAKRPTISMSLPGTCAGTITVGSRNSPCRPARTGGPPAGHPGHPPGPAGRLSRPAAGDSARRGALFFLQERKQREIAKILGIGLPLVKYRIRKARELLAQFLRKEAP